MDTELVPGGSGETPVPPTAAATALVVFTDVDGVLRDPETRRFDAAREALQILADHQIPLVLTSAHASAELLRLQDDLGTHAPFICESGAALCLPAGYFADLPRLGTRVGDWEVLPFGEPREVVCEALYQVADRVDVPVSGFSRLSLEALAAREGLGRLEAQLAMQRQFDEPFLIPGDDPEARTRLFEAMRRAGFRCFTGPRCHYATGVQDPGHALRLLISLFRLHRESVLVVGLGDDWTDRMLLREVDVPVVVRNPSIDQRRLLRSLPGAYLTNAAGPAGWSEAILGSFAV